MDIPVVHPKPLKPEATIEIVAPAGPVSSPDELMCSVANLERMGFHVRFSDRIFHSERYFAGPDQERAEELMRAIEDPEVQAIISLRGGYGCSRLVPLLDPCRIRRHCKIFMGFSDLTTLHLYLRRRYGWVTFHGPMATSAALRTPGKDRENHMFRLWTDPDYLPSFSFPALQSWFPGTAEGELIGGCLSLLTASIGTPYEPIIDGKILFLEDLGEPPYRIDRMLTQLLQAHKLDQVSGVLLGDFIGCDPDQGAATEETLKEILGRMEVPVLAHFPAGHGPDNWALPLGLPVRIDAGNRRIDFLKPAVNIGL